VEIGIATGAVTMEIVTTVSLSGTKTVCNACLSSGEKIFIFALDKDIPLPPVN
jgi:hypothetical protein